MDLLVSEHVDFDIHADQLHSRNFVIDFDRHSVDTRSRDSPIP